MKTKISQYVTLAFASIFAIAKSIYQVFVPPVGRPPIKTIRLKLFQPLSIALCCIVLSACGGGSSSPSNPSPNTSTVSLKVAVRQ